MNILRSLVIWAGLLFWPALYLIGGWTVIWQAILVLSVFGFITWVARDEWRASRLASIPMTVATADLAYVSTMLGFIALRLDVAVGLGS